VSVIPPAAPEVTCRAVAKTFPAPSDPVVVFEPLDLRLEPGSVTALVGPSGCGKSTLLRIIAGLEEPDPGGSVRIGGDEPLEVRRRGEVAIAFQDASLLPWRTAAGNVALAQRLARQEVPEGPLRLSATITGPSAQLSWSPGSPGSAAADGIAPEPIGPVLDMTELSDDFGATLRFTGAFAGISAVDLVEARWSADFTDWQLRFSAPQDSEFRAEPQGRD